MRLGDAGDLRSRRVPRQKHLGEVGECPQAALFRGPEPGGGASPSTLLDGRPRGTAKERRERLGRCSSRQRTSVCDLPGPLRTSVPLKVEHR